MEEFNSPRYWPVIFDYSGLEIPERLRRYSFCIRLLVGLPQGKHFGTSRISGIASFVDDAIKDGRFLVFEFQRLPRRFV
jgi:hypothetical protein